MWYAHKSVTSREARDAASTRPILAIEGLSSARAKVPTDREIEINLNNKCFVVFKVKILVLFETFREDFVQIKTNQAFIAYSV